MFALHTLLPHATALGKSVSVKLISELTAEDLRDYDLIYVGFVRAMATWREYFLATVELHRRAAVVHELRAERR